MNGQVTSPGHVRLVLPGDWAMVPLTDEEATQRFARRIVRARVGQDDRLARVRREVTQNVCETAATARRAGAHTLAVALDIVPGVPFAASLLGRDVPWPEPDEDEVEVGEGGVADRLARAYPSSEIVELPAGPSARFLEAGTLRGKESQVSSVSVVHRIPRPDTDEILTLRFTGPDVGAPRAHRAALRRGRRVGRVHEAARADSDPGPLCGARTERTADRREEQENACPSRSS